MKPNLVVSSKGSLTLKRLTLSGAIDALAEEERHAAGVARAIKNAERMVSDAVERLSTATSHVLAAKSAQTNGMLNAATAGNEFKDDGILAKARLAETLAADELSSAQDALVALQAKAPQKDFMGRDAIERARKIVEAAVDEVVRSEADVQGLIARLHETERRYVEERAELAYLLSNRLAPQEDELTLCDLLKPRMTAEFLPSVFVTMNAVDSSRIATMHGAGGWKTLEGVLVPYPVFPAAKSWSDARATLMRDPAAPLPSTS